MRQLLPICVLFFSSLAFAAPTAFQTRLGTWSIVSCSVSGNPDVCKLTIVSVVNRDLADGGSATVIEGQRSDAGGSFSFRQILTAQGMPNVACTESVDTAVCNFQGNAQTASARAGASGTWLLDIVATAAGKPLQVHLVLRK